MRVFVYGTLTNPDRVQEVLDSFVFVGPATLRGLHAVDGQYPTLAPDGRVGGRLLRTEEVDALDAYEGVADGLYTRVSVPLSEPGNDSVGSGETADAVSDPAGTASDDESDTVDAVGDTTASDDAASGNADTPDRPMVEVYVGDPERLDASADWPGDRPFPDAVDAYLREHPVSVVRR